MSLLFRALSGTSSFCLNDGTAPGRPVRPDDLTGFMAHLHLADTAAPARHIDYPAVAARLAPTRNHLYTGLQAFDPTTLVSREQALAFWINLYNILILDAVLTFQVRKSVVGMTRGFLRFFEKAAYRIGGQRYSANDIEHGLLRDNQGHPYGKATQFPAGDARCPMVLAPMEPRIHFALNCASHSCPPIRVYAPDQIEDQLDLAARSFVDAETQVQADPPRLTLSTLFKWYAQDFAAGGGIVPFIVAHLPSPDPRTACLKAIGDNVRLQYSPYNWKLNGRL